MNLTELCHYVKFVIVRIEVSEEEEKDRLARECSQIYEDSLGKTRLVNEDIYNEVKNITDKMQELEGNNVKYMLNELQRHISADTDKKLLIFDTDIE